MTKEETKARFQSWCQREIGNNCSDEDYAMFNNIMALLEQSSEDCVSRKSLLDKLDPLYKEKIKTAPDNMAEGFLQVSNLIKYEPPVTPTQRWIPVSERLPEDRNLVLVTAYWHETYQVMMASYYGDGLWWCVPFNNCGEHMQKLNPIAWQPLPKSYE